jgi:hypothetical protein
MMNEQKVLVVDDNVANKVAASDFVMAGKVEQPNIMICYLNKDRLGDQIRTLPFKPGMTIDRCGKKYQVDKNGTQRRIK